MQILLLKNFSFENGKRALESHMQRVRHKQKTSVKSGSIFKTVRKTTSDTNVNTSATTSKVLSIPAEIFWALKVVQSNLSLNSCNDLNSLFWKMFPDSDIAHSYSIAKTRLWYVINFGIATNFRIAA